MRRQTVMIVILVFILLGHYPGISMAAGRVGIMPFLAGKYHTGMDEIVEKTISCSISQLCFEPQDIKPGAERKLTSLVRQFMETRLDPGVMLPAAASEGAYGSFARDENKDTLRTLAVLFGEETGADYVLVGTVWRYRDRNRETSAYERAASVAFVVYLVSVPDGKRIWRGYYDESQGALTDDLANAPLFFKGGAKWLTGDEIARIGVKSVFSDFPFEALNRRFNSR